MAAELADHLQKEKPKDLEGWVQAKITKAADYINYLETAPDESNQLPALVQYLKLLEGSRGNSILSYLPEYEELFRTAGY